MNILTLKEDLLAAICLLQLVKRHNPDYCRDATDAVFANLISRLGRNLELLKKYNELQEL